MLLLHKVMILRMVLMSQEPLPVLLASSTVRMLDTSLLPFLPAGLGTQSVIAVMDQMSGKVRLVQTLVMRWEELPERLLRRQLELLWRDLRLGRAWLMRPK